MNYIIFLLYITFNIVVPGQKTLFLTFNKIEIDKRLTHLRWIATQSISDVQFFDRRRQLVGDLSIFTPFFYAEARRLHVSL